MGFPQLSHKHKKGPAASSRRPGECGDGTEAGSARLANPEPQSRKGVVHNSTAVPRDRRVALEERCAEASWGQRRILEGVAARDAGEGHSQWKEKPGLW